MQEVVITINLVAFEQKDYLFKLTIEEKLQRLTFLKRLATDLFKQSNYHKALKLYGKVHSYFRTKDAKNNFQKEDESTDHLTGLTTELDLLNKTRLTNICVIHAKSKAWKEVLKYANEALLTDHNYSKALYHKGRALIELTKYTKAIETLKQAAGVDSRNSEIQKEISRAK